MSPSNDQYQPLGQIIEAHKDAILNENRMVVLSSKIFGLPSAEPDEECLSVLFRTGDGAGIAHQFEDGFVPRVYPDEGHRIVMGGPVSPIEAMGALLRAQQARKEKENQNKEAGNGESSSSL